MLGGVRGIFRLLECQQNFAADAQRVAECLEAGRKFLPFRMAEVTGLTAQCEDKLVVVEDVPSEEHVLLLEIKPGHPVAQYGDVKTV